MFTSALPSALSHILFPVQFSEGELCGYLVPHSLQFYLLLTSRNDLLLTVCLVPEEVP